MNPWHPHHPPFLFLKILPFLSPGSPVFISREEGHEIFKAVLLLSPIFRWDRASLFLSLCLWCVYVCVRARACVCVCICMHRTQQQLQHSLCTADDLHLSHTGCKINATFGPSGDLSTCSASSYWSLRCSSERIWVFKKRFYSSQAFN